MAAGASGYRLRYQSDGSRVSAQARQLIELFGTSGNLEALGGLAGLADRQPYFTGAGTMSLATLTAHARAIQALSGGAGKFIRSTGANTAVMQDMVGVVSQSGGVPTGAIVERGSNANGEYVRFADGTQICTKGGLSQNVNQAANNVFISAGEVIASFPTTFINTDIAGFYSPQSSARWGYCRPFSTGGYAALQISYSQSATLVTGTIVAIGRWF